LPSRIGGEGERGRRATVKKGEKKGGEEFSDDLEGKGGGRSLRTFLFDFVGRQAKKKGDTSPFQKGRGADPQDH